MSEPNDASSSPVGDDAIARLRARADELRDALAQSGASASAPEVVPTRDETESELDEATDRRELDGATAADDGGVVDGADRDPDADAAPDPIPGEDAATEELASGPAEPSDESAVSPAPMADARDLPTGSSGLVSTDLLESWGADDDGFSAEAPTRNWSNAIAAAIIVGVLVLGVVVGWVLIDRSGDDGPTATGPRGDDARVGSVLDEDIPTLEDLTSDITLPPGPDEGLAVAERGVSVVADRFDAARREGTYAAVLANPNPDWTAQGVQVRVVFLAPDGSSVGEDAGFVELVLPSQRVAVAGLFFDAPPAVADIALEIDVARWIESGPVEGGFEVAEVQTAEAEFSGVRTTFQLTSRYPDPVRDVGVTAVYRDASGRILGGADTFVDQLDPGVALPTEISLLANLDPALVTATELYPAASFGFELG